MAVCFLSTLTVTQADVVTNFTQTSIQAALTNGGTITFSTNGTFLLTKQLKISTNVIIDGSGLTITFNGGTNRVFYITNDVAVTFANITITNGTSTNGSGIFIGSSNAIVNLTNCVLALNDAIGADGMNGRPGDIGENGGNGGAGIPGIGGAIYNLGALTIANSTITNNVAFGGHGGNGGNGGNDSLFGGNGGNGANGAIGWGGGIYNGLSGTVSIIDSTIGDNHASGGDGGVGGTGGGAPFPGETGSSGIGATGLGGGIYNLGTVIIANSTFMSNSAAGGGAGNPPPNNNGSNGSAGNGGAVYNLGTLTIGNSTFTENLSQGGKGGDVTGNSARGGNGGSGNGGAIFHNSTTTNNIVSCTFAANNAIGGAAGTSAVSGNSGSSPTSLGGNIYHGTSGKVRLQNTILAKGISGPNCSGTIVDGGFNLSSDGTPGNFLAANKNKDPKLGPLSTNGGPTLTMALLTNSPAIDKGDPSILGFDQRGVARPEGTNTDIGAYELVPTFSISGKVTEGTNGISGITITAGNRSTVSQSNGNYAIFGLLTSNYVVTPTQIGAGLLPLSTNVFVGTNAMTPGTNATGVNFFANLPMISPPTPGFASEEETATNAIMIFDFAAMPQRTYRIQASTNLTNWINISTNVSSTNGSFQFVFPLTQTNRTKFPHRFFRALIK